MRVKFSSIITRGKIKEGLVDKTGELNVQVGDEHLDTLESPGGYETGAITRLGTPGDFLALGITNGGVCFGRGPKAKVFFG